MSRTINVTLSVSSFDKAIREIRAYKEWVERKAKELARRLADEGAWLASIKFEATETFYDGIADCNVTVEQRGENTFAIVASGETVLILEFGAGIRHGGGHPMAAEMGYGPGTYPGQTHALDPGFWYFTSGGKSRQYSEGNMPSMAMYTTAKDLRDSLERIAKEIFSS